MSTGVFSIAPTTALGSSTPTYTGATAKTTIDFEGLLKMCLSGEVRCLGGRRVYNLNGLGNTDTVAGWTTFSTATDLGVVAGVGYNGSSGREISFGANAAAQWYSMNIIASTVGNTYVGSIAVRAKTGTTTIRIKYYTGSGGDVYSSDITVTTIPIRLSVSFVAGGNNLNFSIANNVAGNSANVYVSAAHLEDVTGQSNQNPAEYVSRGVLSSPVYHGVGVDGMKVFTTLNGNTVASNVVTEATGLPITSARAECAGGVTAGVVDAVGPVGYLAEGARTNLQKQNRTLTTAPWTNQGTPAATQNATGIDGATTAWTLTDNDAGAVEHIYCGAVELALSGSTQYTYSIFVGKQGSAPSGYPCISVDNGTYLAGCTIDPYSGTATVWTAYTGFTVLTSSATCTSWNSNFWRVELTFTTHSSMTTGTATIIPAGRTTANSATGTNAVAATGSTIFDAPQIEAGAFASSPIITTTAAVARNADVDSYASAGNWNETGSTVTVSAPSIPSVLTTNQVPFSAATDASNYAVIYINSSGFAVAEVYVGGAAQAVVAGTTDLRGSTGAKITAVFATNDVRLYVNGVAEGTPDTSATMPSCTTINIGCFVTGGNQTFFPVRLVKVYPRALSAAQAAAL